MSPLRKSQKTVKSSTCALFIEFTQNPYVYCFTVEIFLLNRIRYEDIYNVLLKLKHGKYTCTCISEKQARKIHILQHYDELYSYTK